MVLRTSLLCVILVGMASAYPFCMYGSLRKGMYYHDKYMSSCTSGGVTKTAESDYTLMDAGAFPHAIKHGSWRGGGKSQIVCEYFDCPDSAVGPLDKLEQCCGGRWYTKKLVPLANDKKGWIYLLPHRKQVKWLHNSPIVTSGDWKKKTYSSGKCKKDKCHA